MRSSALLLALSLACPAAQADDFIVDAPRVEEGERSAEADLTYGGGHGSDENGYFGQRYGVNFGVTNWWETSFFGEFEREPGGEPFATHAEWENILVPVKPGTYWLDFGLFLELDKSTRSDVPDNAEARLLLEKDMGRFENVANIIFNRQFGPAAQGAATGGGVAWITTYRFSEEFKPGIQYTSDMGPLTDMPSFNRQEQVLGPVAEGNIAGFDYVTGVLFGLSNGGAAATVRFDLQHGF